MADNIYDPNEWKSPRALLAFYWSICTSLMLFFILYNWGHILAILTLVIGLVGGTIIGGIFGVYFAGNLTKKPDTTITAGDNQTTNITPPTTPTSGTPIVQQPGATS